MAMSGALWVTNHVGKMEGVNSIGTSCADNPHCIARRMNGESVCSKCYAATYMKMRKALRQRLADNADVLTTRLLKENEIPVLNGNIFRFESFGDLYNAIHIENYVKICERNPYTNFGLWTKNTWILEEVFNDKGIKKPDNLSIVVSSPLLNEQLVLDRGKFWFVDHVFTVFDKKFIAANGVVINCGARICLKCKRCYMKNGVDYYINEQLK